MLEEDSRRINAAIDHEREELEAELSKVNIEIKRNMDILASDEAKNDRRENAVYQLASDTLARLQVTKANLVGKIEAASNYVSRYTPSQNIGIGTTVKLHCIEKGVDLVIKLVPSFLSKGSIGAVSDESAVGVAIQGHTVGDIVDVHTRIGHLRYQILEQL